MFHLLGRREHSRPELERKLAGAVLHPLRVLGHGLAHAGLRLHASATQLSVWLKGPVYHGSQVDLRLGRSSEGTVLAMFAGGETRPAVVAQVREVAPDARLVPGPEEQMPA